MRILIVSLCFLALGFTQQLSASPLSDARNAGLIVELSNGYVKAQDIATAKVKALAADVNIRRKMAYAKIAKKNNISIATVGSESYQKRMKGKKSKQ